MSKPASRSIAWAVLAASIAAYGAGVALHAARSPVEGIEDFSIADVVWPIPMLGFVLVGAVVVSRRPANPVPWLFLAAGGLMVFNYFSAAYGVAALGGQIELPHGEFMAWFGLWTWIPAFSLFPAFFLLFPTGIPPSPRWRWLLWSVILLQPAYVVAALRISPDLGLKLLRTPNPGHLPGGALLNALANNVTVLLLLVSIASLMVRFRSSRGDERQQVKWFTYAAATLGLLTLAMMAFGGDDPISDPLVAIAMTAALTVMPIATGIAILRYRLYDIDLVINRTIVYVALSAVLAGVYVGGVALMQAVLPVGGNDLAVAGSTLAVAALFNPLRRRMQGFIDHYFYRRKYDAQRTIEQFSARLRDEIDLDALTHELVGVVRSTMQPTHVNVWLRTSEDVTS